MIQTIRTNAKSLELTGEETHIHFDTGYPYFWVRNDSTGTVLLSMFPNVSEGGDGVVPLPAGSSTGTMHGVRKNDIYVLGSGKIVIMGTISPNSPFM